MKKTITNKKFIKEELDKKDIVKLRQIIRDEIANIYFQLYRKRAIWSK